MTFEADRVRRSPPTGLKLQNISCDDTMNPPSLLQSYGGRRRRGRDSNPGYGFPYNKLATCRFQPLSHLSLYILNFKKSYQLATCLRRLADSATPPEAGAPRAHQPPLQLLLCFTANIAIRENFTNPCILGPNPSKTFKFYAIVTT